jgi:hypothetical protein
MICKNIWIKMILYLVETKDSLLDEPLELLLREPLQPF